MKTAIVIGSGAGGAMIAKELQGNFQVTILEAGGEFKPLNYSVPKLTKLKKYKLFFDERLIQLALPSMKVLKTKENMIVARGKCIGGTTNLSSANGIRHDESLKKIGINLDQEYKELYKEIPITMEHTEKWSELTKKIYSIFENQDLNPMIVPKMIYKDKCVSCGKCILGCKFDAKWDSRKVIDECIEKGVKVITKSTVKKLLIQNNKVTGVQVSENGKRKVYTANLVILAAGGLGTPTILQSSGIKCEEKLFVDPLICVAAPYKDSRMSSQLPMPFISQQKGYMISPYFDYLSFFFNKEWNYPEKDIVSLMIKLSDTNTGSYTNKKLLKRLTEEDQKMLKEAIIKCKKILIELGISEDEIFLGTLNGGHPGGMFPLSKEEAGTLHNKKLPSNLYLSDATLFPESFGNPPILTIMALAKQIAKICMNKIDMF